MNRIKEWIRSMTLLSIEPGLLKKIEAEDRINSNYTTVRFFSLIAAACVTGMLLSSFGSDVLSRHRLVYLVGAVVSLVLYFVNEFFYYKHRGWIVIMPYVGIALYLTYGIALGTYTDPGMQSSTFMVLMIFVPLLFIDRPHRTSLVILIFDLLFIWLARRTKTGAVLTADTTDAIIFGVLSLISNYYMTMIKYKRFVYEREMYRVGNTDQLTKTKNRNCYEHEKLSSYTSCQKSLSLIYIDVNGLHELNNTKGHSAGDEMLKYVALCLHEAFDWDNTYRIGGDEFVALVRDIPEEDSEQKMEQINEKLALRHYHISWGISTEVKEKLVMEPLLQDAEQKMYAAKAEYYARIGKQHR